MVAEATKYISDAYKRFSRNAQFDLQVYSKVINDFDTIIELGVGNGRLCSEWLNRGKKVIGIETEPFFCNFLKNEYSFSIETGFLQLINYISELDYQNSNSVLLAPFNLLFHLPKLEIFTNIIETAFSKGVKTTIFDFDKLTNEDISRIKYISTRQVEKYIETATRQEQNKIKIEWIIAKTNQTIYSFNIYTYNYQEVINLLQLNSLKFEISEIDCLQDQHGTEISFIKIRASK
jgi:phospholipid N-methyltransferase